jgi:hypothetical protein
MVKTLKVGKNMQDSSTIPCAFIKISYTLIPHYTQDMVNRMQECFYTFLTTFNNKIPGHCLILPFS